MSSDLITVAEAARMLSMSSKHVIRLCRSGKISHHQEGRWIRVSSDSVKLYLHNTHFDKKKLGLEGLEGLRGHSQA